MMEGKQTIVVGFPGNGKRMKRMVVRDVVRGRDVGREVK
jgi:hypothetical protein